MSPSTANTVNLTPLVFLERAARVHPQKPALRYAEREYSYAQFAAEAQHLGGALHRRVAPGDRVAVLAPNIPQMLVAHFAVPLAGATLVTINTRLSRDEIANILEHSGARIFLVDAEFENVARSAATELSNSITVVVIREDAEAGPDTYAALVREGEALDPLPWIVNDEQAVIAINYTSGTTGKPKGVMYSHRGAYLNSLGLIHHAGFTADTRYLWTLPMFHCNGWCAPWSVTAVAGLHVCLRTVREDAVWSAIDEFEVTHLSGAPTVLSIVADAPQAHPVEALSMMTGGAPPSPTTIEKLEALGASVTHAYGLTEVYGPYTTCEYQTAWSALPAGERAARMARQGVPMIQSGGVRIVDEYMHDVPADGETLGEIVMRGNNVMLGYFRDDAATEEAFRGGWFHSGDLGVMHPDGYLEVRDRSKDLIISGGENISSIEVENTLLSHVAVADAAVVAVPHEKWGERPVAFVVLHAEIVIESAELERHVRSLLAGYKVPDRFHLVEALPRTSTGKVMKVQLRELAVLAD
ncbi:AMP-binding protein [Leifsonia sp. H3M29-4]|uniref:AMP-binding protein n=1 Tax=Salinibacterium metalliresistens TaxID=3031321 RepID=UPI0023DB5AD5|nr:AMP-binding protein [Salinibacterium metalliresistens]MDF1478594.1 AMP-binding protein [Salinibacterium metalliresistens]